MVPECGNDFEISEFYRFCTLTKLENEEIIHEQIILFKKMENEQNNLIYKKIKIDEIINLEELKAQEFNDEEKE